MKHIITFLTFLIFSMPVMADFTLIVPQKPGGGTSIWAGIVAEQLSIALDEKVIVRHIPGARDIPGFNEFHNNAQYDDNTIMVSHGGNGVSFLQENVDYNYNNYESIGLMNLNIIVAQRSTTSSVIVNPDTVAFSAGSGMVPEAFAMAMLMCNPNDYPNGPQVNDYIKCFNERVTWVRGMSSGERRLAFKRGELTGTRENPAAFKKHVQPMIDVQEAGLWFHHGILDATTGEHNDDPNYLGLQFESLYESLYDHKPSGEFYDAYKLVKSFRDGMQKALWVREGNPNTDRLRKALHTVATNPALSAKIIEKVGNYEWIVGVNGNIHRDFLMSLITGPTLKSLIKFNNEALGLASIYKDNLVNKD